MSDNKKHPAQLTISRIYGGGSDNNTITIRVRDDDAGITFIELEIGLSEFARCVTGSGHVDCSFEVRGLSNVGKRIERDTLEFKLPGPVGFRDRKAIARAALPNVVPDGWTASEYFGSRDSFFTRDGEEWARTRISRWVDKD